jgi:hypothetical protein
LRSYRESCYDSFIRRNRIVQKKTGKPMWEAHSDTYECQWNFDEEYFEIIKFIEDSALFTMLLASPWIERDQARRKEEEPVLEQHKQELKEFMTRKIAHLIEEQENRSKLFNTRDPDVKAARTLEDQQKTEVLIPDKEDVLPLTPRKELQQHEVTMLREDKNQNGKRHTETKLTGKKARKLSKKRDKIEKLQKFPEVTL